MKEYHKIQTIFERDQKGRIREGEWSNPAFEYLAGNPWAFSEKVNGSNIRIGWDGEKVRFGGRTDNAQIHSHIVAHLQDRFLSDSFLTYCRERFPNGEFMLVGEGYGAKIQKGAGNYKSDGVDFVLFDVRAGDFWLERHNVEDVGQCIDVPVVPIVGTGTLHDLITFVQEGFSSTWGDFPAEGIVARPMAELCFRNGKRIITKLKHRDFQAKKLH